MAGETQYINPIIQAMLGAHRINQERAQLQQRSEETKADQQLRQQQLRQQLKQIEYEHEHHQAQLGINKQQQALLGQQARANAILQANKMASELGPSAADAMVGQIAPELGGGQIQWTTPEQRAKFEADEVLRKTQAQEQALAPGRQAGYRHQTDLQNAQNEAAAARQAKANANALEIAKLNRESAERIAARNNATTIAAAKIRVQNLEASYGDDALAQAIDGAWMGTFDPDKLSTRQERTTFNTALARGGELDALPRGRAWIKYKENLDNFANLQDVISDAKELALGFSRDSKNAEGNWSIGIPFTSGAVGMVLPGSPLRARMDTIKSKVDPIVRQLQGDKRISDKDAERIFGGIFDPASTQTDNLKRIDELTKIFQNAARASFPNVSKERMQQVFGKLGISDLLPEHEPAKPTVKRIAVRRKADGTTGTIDESDFNADLYERR